MNWMYIGVLIIVLIGTILIIGGVKLNKTKHENGEYAEDIVVHGAGLVETLIVFFLSLLLKYIPFWIMRIFMILLGLAIIILGIFILLFG